MNANDKHAVPVSLEKLQTLRSTLESAKSKVKEVLDGFDKRWEIKNFPNFHRSVAMTHTGWEVLKVYLSYFNKIVKSYFLFVYI